MGPRQPGWFARIAPFASRFMETRDDSISRVRLARNVCDLGTIRDLQFWLGAAQYWRIALRGRRLYRGDFRWTHRPNREVARRKADTLHRPILWRTWNDNRRSRSQRRDLHCVDSRDFDVEYFFPGRARNHDSSRK